MFRSDPNKTLFHKGKVNKADNNSVLVEISTGTACSGCHAEGACGITGQTVKYVEVTGHFNVKPGDEVTVQVEQSAGYTALALGYLLPLVILIASLAVLTSFNVPELIAGCVSVLLLLPYFGILFLLRKRIDDKFTFTLKNM